jgi:phage portal protein BeeE
MQDINFLPEWVNRFFGGKKQQRKYYFESKVNYQINKGALYIDTSVPYDLYNTIPQLRTVVDKLAAMFSNGVFKIENIKTNQIEPLPEDLQKLLENPNPLQPQNEFLKQYLTQLIVYGNQFIYKNKPSKLQKYPSAILNITPANIKPVLTGKVFEQLDIKGIVKEYEYTEGLSYKRVFDVSTVLWSKIADLDNPVAGYSPLKAMKYPLSNTVAAYQYLNVISSEKGAIGVLSTSNKDAMGALPMTADEKTEIERIYREENGIEDNQKKIHITTGSVTWSPMSYPTKDLLLMEQIDANFLIILNILGVNQNLFINSTYENLKNGLIQTHNDTVVPYADGFTQALTKFLEIEPGKRLILDYSHLPYLQVDEKIEGEKLTNVINNVNSLLNTGIITPTQANEIIQNNTTLLS